MKQRLVGYPQLTKETNLIDEVRYYVRDHTGWCIASFSDIEKANAAYNKACENYEKYGGDRIEVIKSYDQKQPAP